MEGLIMVSVFLAGVIIYGIYLVKRDEREEKRENNHN